MHDVTALRTEGIEDLLRAHPDGQAEMDPGYRGLARDFPAQVSGPPKKPGKDASPDETARGEQHRHQQSSQRICVEHAIAEPKQGRPLQRYPGRREHFQETARPDRRWRRSWFTSGDGSRRGGSMVDVCILDDVRLDSRATLGGGLRRGPSPDRTLANANPHRARSLQDGLMERDHACPQRDAA
jgi:hypothetical protein